MSSYPYAKLLVDMYEFPKNLTDTIAGLLTEDDIAAVGVAIEQLQSKASGDRMQTIVRHYYGIECERMTLKVLGESFIPPISSSRVGELRRYAQRYMRKTPSLRPVVERVVGTGIEGRWVEQTLRLPSPTQLEALAAEVEKTEVEQQEYKYNFLLDCFPTCIPDDPCPSCRARTLLRKHGILEEIYELANEWVSGPSDDWRSISTRSLELSVRTVNCLLNNNIQTLGQLCTYSARELLRTPNFGEKSLKELEDHLASIGKSLQG